MQHQCLGKSYLIREQPRASLILRPTNRVKVNWLPLTTTPHLISTTDINALEMRTVVSIMLSGGRSVCCGFHRAFRMRCRLIKWIKEGWKVWCCVWCLFNQNYQERVIMWRAHRQPTRPARVLAVTQCGVRSCPEGVVAYRASCSRSEQQISSSPRGHLGSRDGLRTWSAELTHGGSSGLVVDAAEAATSRHTPGGRAGPAVSLLGRVVNLHMGRALGQVFAVMAQAILGDLDGIKVALRAPLGGQGHTCVWGEGC